MRAFGEEGGTVPPSSGEARAQAGDYVAVRIERTSPGTLFGAPLVRTSQALWGDMMHEAAVAQEQAPAVWQEQETRESASMSSC